MPEHCNPRSSFDLKHNRWKMMETASKEWNPPHLEHNFCEARAHQDALAISAEQRRTSCVALNKKTSSAPGLSGTSITPQSHLFWSRLCVMSGRQRRRRGVLPPSKAPPTCRTWRVENEADRPHPGGFKQGKYEEEEEDKEEEEEEGEPWRSVIPCHPERP